MRRRPTVFDFDACIQGMTNQRLGIVQRQKLIYFAYRTYVIGTGKAPFQNRAEAWPLGPVFPDLQHNPSRKGDATALNELMQNVCRRTVECLGHLSGARLIKASHAYCTEWQKARLFVKAGKIGGERITPQLIRKALNQPAIVFFR